MSTITKLTKQQVAEYGMADRRQRAVWSDVRAGVEELKQGEGFEVTVENSKVHTFRSTVSNAAKRAGVKASVRTLETYEDETKFLVARVK